MVEWIEEEAMMLYDYGCVDRQIGDAIGVHLSTIKRWRDRNGLVSNGSSGRPVLMRFWENVDKGNSSECWEWTGHIHQGYGVIHYSSGGTKEARANRVSFWIHYGLPAGDMLVCHKCDNRACVNPYHLYAGTKSDNIRDLYDRHDVDFPDRRGTNNTSSKLTPEEIIDIRERYAEGDISQRCLGDEYGITRTQIGNIVRGRHWAHIGGPITKYEIGGEFP